MMLMNNFESILSMIGWDESRFHSHYRHNAKDWPGLIRDPYFDEILDYVLKKEYDFSEEQEAQFKTTVIETILNACRAANNTHDKFVDLYMWVGQSGIGVYIQGAGEGFDYEAELAATLKMMSSMPENEILYAPKSTASIVDDSHPGRAGTYCLLKYPKHYAYKIGGRDLTMKFSTLDPGTDSALEKILTE